LADSAAAHVAPSRLTAEPANCLPLSLLDGSRALSETISTSRRNHRGNCEVFVFGKTIKKVNWKLLDRPPSLKGIV